MGVRNTLSSLRAADCSLTHWHRRQAQSALHVCWALCWYKPKRSQKQKPEYSHYSISSCLNHAPLSGSLTEKQIPECNLVGIWGRKKPGRQNNLWWTKWYNMGPSWLCCSIYFGWNRGAVGARMMTTDVCSEPVPGVVAVAARWTAIAMWLICILIGVLVVLVGVLLLSAMLRARRHAVASLVRLLVVVVFVRCHQVASLIWGRVVSRVVALSRSLALQITWTHQEQVRLGAHHMTMGGSEMYTYIKGYLQSGDAGGVGSEGGGA